VAKRLRRHRALAAGNLERRRVSIRLPLPDWRVVDFATTKGAKDPLSKLLASIAERLRENAATAPVAPWMSVSKADEAESRRKWIALAPFHWLLFEQYTAAAGAPGIEQVLSRLSHVRLQRIMGGARRDNMTPEEQEDEAHSEGSEREETDIGSDAWQASWRDRNRR